MVKHKVTNHPHHAFFGYWFCLDHFKNPPPTEGDAQSYLLAIKKKHEYYSSIYHKQIDFSHLQGNFWHRTPQFHDRSMKMRIINQLIINHYEPYLIVNPHRGLLGKSPTTQPIIHLWMDFPHKPSIFNHY